MRPTLTVVRPPGLAECRQLYRSHLLTRGEKPRDAAWTSLIPVETCRPLLLPDRLVAVTTDRDAPPAPPCPSRDGLRAHGSPSACRGACGRGRGRARASPGLS